MKMTLNLPSARTLRRTAWASTLLAASLPAFGASFSNLGSISIPDVSPASPYPSHITVSGLGTSLSSITVTLDNYSHSFSIDIAIVLQNPTGANVMLMGRVGAYDSSPVTLTFDDTAGSSLQTGNAFVTGSYLPTDETGGQFLFSDGGSHAEPTSWTTSLATFSGSNPNGVWKLFVEDFVGGDSGSIAGGWSVNISTVPEPSTYAAIAASMLIGMALIRRRKSV